jgi:hypothetical protein
MASLDDILARVAPKSVDGLQVEWNLDSAGAWIEVAGWFSPGTRFGEPKYQVPFKKTVARTGDSVYDVSCGVADVLDQVTDRLRPVVPRFLKAEVYAGPPIFDGTGPMPPEPVKRKAGRPKGSKNKPKTRRPKGSASI